MGGRGISAGVAPMMKPAAEAGFFLPHTDDSAVSVGAKVEVGRRAVYAGPCIARHKGMPPRQAEEPDRIYPSC